MLAGDEESMVICLQTWSISHHLKLFLYHTTDFYPFKKQFIQWWAMSVERRHRRTTDFRKWGTVPGLQLGGAVIIIFRGYLALGAQFPNF